MKIIRTESYIMLTKQAMENPCWKGYKMIGTKDKNGKKVPNCVPNKEANLEKEAKKSPAWQRSEGKNPNGGLNEKGRKSYKKDHPGSNLKPPVKDSHPTGERKKRQDSFCARMKGMKSKLTSEETKNDPDSRINKSLRTWNC